MKKLISLVLSLCLIFSLFTFVNVSAQEIEYLVNTPCDKVYNAFEFTSESLCEDLSDYDGEFVFYDDGSFDFKTTSTASKQEFYFLAPKDDVFIDESLIGTQLYNYHLYCSAYNMSNAQSSYDRIEISILNKDLEGVESQGALYWKSSYGLIYESYDIIIAGDDLWDSEVGSAKYVKIILSNNWSREEGTKTVHVSSIKHRFGLAEHEKTIVGKRERTCEEPGHSGREYCAVCQNFFTIGGCHSPLGHDKVIDQAKDPSCTQTGLAKGEHCGRCEKVLVEQKEIPKLSHNYKTKVTKKATYFEKGEKTLTCKDCKKTVKKSIDKKKLSVPKVSVNPHKNKISVKYTKVNNASGFQVRYKRTNAKKWSYKTFKTSKSATKYIQNLKKNKNYYVGVRSYIKNSKDKKAYSTWTSNKKIKVK